jgi:hypothetical protein
MVLPFVERYKCYTKYEVTNILLLYEYHGNVKSKKTERIFVFKMQFYFISPESSCSVEQFLNTSIIDFTLGTYCTDTNKPKHSTAFGKSLCI